MSNVDDLIDSNPDSVGLYPFIRSASLHLENDSMGHEPINPEVAATLREYADMLEAGTAGWEQAETFTSKGGTRVFVTWADWRGERLPRKPSERPW